MTPLCTHHHSPLESVNDATLDCDVVLIFGSHREAFDGIASCVMYLYPMFATYVLHTCTQTSYIW